MSKQEEIDNNQFEKLMKEGYQETASLNYQIAEDYFEVALETWPEYEETKREEGVTT